MNNTLLLAASKYLAATSKQTHVERKGRRPVHQETPRLSDKHGHGEIPDFELSSNLCISCK